MRRTDTIAEPSVEPSLSVPMCWARFKIQCAYLPDDGFSGSIVFPRPMQYARQQVIESLELNRKLLSLVIPVILGGIIWCFGDGVKRNHSHSFQSPMR